MYKKTFENNYCKYKVARLRNFVLNSAAKLSTNQSLASKKSIDLCELLFFHY